MDNETGVSGCVWHRLVCCLAGISITRQSAARLHQPALETRERPVPDLRGQAEPAPEVAKIVSQYAQLQAHFVRPEPTP